MILEKEVGISEDPRGVYLAGDAVRTLYQLGIGDQMDIIGHRRYFLYCTSKVLFLKLTGLKTINFHKSTFQNPAFLSLDLTEDWLEHVVPGGILQIQPRLGIYVQRIL